MKFSAIFAAVAAATVVSAQGYNSTSEAPSSSTVATITDSRTLNVPKPSSMAPTAITQIDTITSQCGSVTVLLPGSTHVMPLNGTASGGTRTASTYTGSSATGTNAAAQKTQAAALVGAGGLALAAFLL